MKKNVIALLAALLALAMIFAGCSSSSSSQSSSGSDSGSASDSGDSELEFVEIEYYMPGEDCTDSDMVNEEINKYLKEKINAQVNLHWIEYSDYNQKMSAMTGAGQRIDLLHTATSYYNFPVNVQAGAFIQLDDLLTEYAPDLIAELPEYVLEGGKVNGGIYCIPSYKDVADTFSFIWNSTMAQEVGMDEDKLNADFSFLSDLYDRVKEFKELRDAKYPDYAKFPMFGPQTSQTEWWAWDQIIGGVCTNVGGIDFFADQGSGEKVFNAYSTPEFVEVAKTAKKWVDEGLLPVANSNLDPDGTNSNAGIIPCRMGNGLVAISDHQLSQDWVGKLKRSDVSVSYTAYLQAAATAIPVSCECPERVAMFLNIQYTDETYNTLSRMGIEGVHYNVVKDANGNDRADFTGTANEDTSNRGYYYWYGYQWGNLFKTLLPADQPDDLFTALMDMNADAGKYQTNLGFTFNTDAVANEIAACAGVIDEYYKPLMEGVYDDVEGKIAEFNEKLEANDMQKIIDEAQSQLNEWRAAKGLSTYEG